MKTKLDDIEKAIEENKQITDQGSAQTDSPSENQKIYAGRNDFLFKSACSLYRKAWPDEAVETAIQALNIHATSHLQDNFEDGPLHAKEVKALLNSAKKYKGQITNKKMMEAEEALSYMNNIYSIVMEAGKTIAIREERDGQLKRTVHIRSSFNDIRNFYKELVITKIDNDVPQAEPLGKFWTNHPDAERYDAVVFKPKGAKPNEYNLWKGFAVEPIQGDWSLLRDHIFENICSGNKEWFDYFMGWLARMFQQPDCHGEVAIVLKGGKGTGKSILFRLIGHLLGQHFLHISNPGHLVGNFNSHLQDTILLFADEAFWAGHKKGESTLKTLVTEETLFIEPKGVNAFTAPNYLHIAMASNAPWVVPASGDERRYFVLEVKDGRKQDTEYFGNLVEQMESGGYGALLYDLLKWDITDFDVRKVPITDAIQEQKIRSMEPIDKWVYERLCVGRWLLHDYDSEKVTMPEDDWCGPIRTRYIQNEYIRDLRDVGVQYRSNSTELGIRLKSLFPDMKKKTMSRYGRKDQFYTFPSLEECRASFEKYNNTEYEWPEDELEDDDSPI